MGFRSVLCRPFVANFANQQDKWSSKPVLTQLRQFEYLAKKGRDTAFGREHGFDGIRNYHDFKKLVPVSDYESFSPYIKRIINGEKDVLWPGKPAYFAKTSGTTSGIKYIPLSAESIPYHINGARNALFNYILETGKAGFLDGGLIFLSGSPVLEEKGNIKTGRLSGIVNHHVPVWARMNQKPSYQTNCIEDWETKIEKIIDETIDARMTLISGIPPWVQMYFDRIIERTGKKISAVFPDFSVFVHGGVNFEPYRARLIESIGRQVDSIETYPASEGFIAYQYRQNEPGLLLLLNSGIFYEFIPADEFYSEDPPRLTIEDVKEGINYALIINSNAGLWGYSIGDTVKFISLNPPLVQVTGRISHFISAFGEHVIVEEVEKALKNALTEFTGTEIAEFTVAPVVNSGQGLPHHEWLIEFSRMPGNLDDFSAKLDASLRKLNAYYDDLVTGAILQPLKIVRLRKDSFRDYMKTIGKLGGQNKVPRLSNNRLIADQLAMYVE
ncbi:MAG TPA: GH3 auxin-responsive promoter family protein [Cyclobacteriaceae bacterium]|nr:GH3 auxin-responsive promoter family protein [Cyclobacteriaceae bacterium]